MIIRFAQDDSTFRAFPLLAQPESGYDSRMQIPGVSGAFVAPSPGAWEIEDTHMSRPVSRWSGALFPERATAGMRDGMKRYGVLLDYIEFAVVNGFTYMCARGVGAPKGAKAPPPKFIFKILTKVHPEVRRRIRRSAEVFETKFWREDVKRWDEEVKPALIRKYRGLQSVDPRSLSTGDLIRHLDTCAEAVSEAFYIHHSFNPTAMLPLGDFLSHATTWTGLPPSRLLPLLRGASPISLGSSPEMGRLMQAIAGRDDIKLLLASSDPCAALEAITSRKDEIGARAREYVACAGIRVSPGYDVSDSSLSEMPETLVGTITAALAGSGRSAADTFENDLATVRALVPETHRGQFDELLGEARFTYRMRDERGYLNDSWAAGLARRALLAAGERLAAEARLDSPLHAVDFTPREIADALAGRAAPSREEIAAYANYRATKSTDDAPRFLNHPPSGPPPAEWLPPAAERTQRAIDVCLAEMFAKRDDAAPEKTIVGFPASPGSVTGIARLVRESGDMIRVKDGDILVTRSTGPSYNELLPLLRGVITDRGGTLSHAALVAREYGIPAVVGCGNATALIPDGAKIRIDGTDGRIEILS